MSMAMPMSTKFSYASVTLTFMFYSFIIESCTEHKQNIVDIMVQRRAPSNK